MTTDQEKHNVFFRLVYFAEQDGVKLYPLYCIGQGFILLNVQVVFHSVCILHWLYSITHWWAWGLLTYLSCCEFSCNKLGERYMKKFKQSFVFCQFERKEGDTQGDSEIVHLLVHSSLVGRSIKICCVGSRCLGHLSPMLLLSQTEAFTELDFTFAISSSNMQDNLPLEDFTMVKI